MSGLVARDVAVSLGGREALRGVAFTAGRGRVVGLIGPNGAGKTTLLRVLGGLMAPDRGAVTLGGVELAAMPRASRAKRISYLPADAPVHWPLRVDRLVMLGRIPRAGLWRGSGDADVRMTEAAMSRTGVLHLADRAVSSLSSGERARVLIARALAGDPETLLADEPVSSLDPYHQLRIMELFRDFAAGGRIVVSVLHDLTLAARFCDDLALVADGRIVREGHPEEVLTSDAVGGAYGVETVTVSTDAGTLVAPWRRLDAGNETP